MTTETLQNLQSHPTTATRITRWQIIKQMFLTWWVALVIVAYIGVLLLGAPKHDEAFITLWGLKIVGTIFCLLVLVCFWEVALSDAYTAEVKALIPVVQVIDMHTYKYRSNIADIHQMDHYRYLVNVGDLMVKLKNLEKDFSLKSPKRDWKLTVKNANQKLHELETTIRRARLRQEAESRDLDRKRIIAELTVTFNP